MKAAPCPDRVQTVDCHPCPSFGGGRKRGLENKVLAARKGGFTTRNHLIATAGVIDSRPPRPRAFAPPEL